MGFRDIKGILKCGLRAVFLTLFHVPIDFPVPLLDVVIKARKPRTLPPLTNYLH